VARKDIVIGEDWAARCGKTVLGIKIIVNMKKLSKKVNQATADFR